MLTKKLQERTIINPDRRIYVAGHRGLAGSAILRALEARGFKNLIVRTHAELDLTDAVATQAFFVQERPEFVSLSAAKVSAPVSRTIIAEIWVAFSQNLSDNLADRGRRARARPAW